ncbi:molybdenum cofactor sulfurase isoform X2 [Pseudophryne corroboree]|uniref:molybdenum cofactor sulfurase isoform X2 n=1 Tax=Pseudophryne corroboree TaxID=495146 RepID=UPI003081487D
MEGETDNFQYKMKLQDLLCFSYFEKLCANPSDYGYGGTIGEMRKKEFSRIEGVTYLDHLGTALFPESLLQKFMADLSGNVYGNPHSSNLSSRLTHDTIEHVRYRVLQHFNASPEDYTVIFTSGSTAALKLVAENFPWTPRCSDSSGSYFCYLTDNHTSVVGIRGMLNVPSLAVTPEDLLLSKSQKAFQHQNHSISHLFCYPALSNFSGTKYPLSWIGLIKSGKMSPTKVPGNWFVLLDAASFVSTAPLDLSACQPDFVNISFYKIFGFPTGLGALIVSNRIAHLLRKKYFGGGTAAAYLTKEDFFVPKESISDRFEDGTVSFLDIIALKHGFDALQKLTGGMDNIRNHTHTLASYTYLVMSALCYANGKPVIRIYTDTEDRTVDVQGPVINFNVLDENGSIIGYTQAGHICGDNMDIIDGRPTGSVRISFGFMSTYEDAQVFLHFIIDTFMKSSSQNKEHMLDIEKFSRIGFSNTEEKSKGFNRKITEGATYTLNHLASSFSTVESTCSCKGKSTMTTNNKAITLSHIYLYPIKSCAAFQVTQWPVAEQGLLFDRNWMVVTENGVCLSQKQEPRLCLIHPSIDLTLNILIIQANGMSPIEIPLNDESNVPAQVCLNKVCGDRVHTYDCGEEIAEWVSHFLARKCRLIRQLSSSNRYAGAKKKGFVDASSPSLSLVNEAQYLLVNAASIYELSLQIPLREETDHTEGLNIDQLTQSFRANLVIDSKIPFQEEEWTELFIGCLHFQVSHKCTRCQIICINQKTGEKRREILQTLLSSRDGKTTFGMYLQNSPCSSYPCLLSVGTDVSFTFKETTQSTALNKEEILEN